MGSADRCQPSRARQSGIGRDGTAFRRVTDGAVKNCRRPTEIAESTSPGGAVFKSLVFSVVFGILKKNAYACR